MDYFIATVTVVLPSCSIVFSNSIRSYISAPANGAERLRERMRLALETQMKRADQRQQRVIQRLNMQNPQPRIHRHQSRIQQLEYRLAESIRSRLSERRERFGNAVTHLEAVSPLATLARG